MGRLAIRTVEFADGCGRIWIGRRPLFCSHVSDMRTTQTDLGVWVRNVLERDDVIMRGVPYCPACGTRQVQIIDKRVPANWKCRKCKHKFEHEPSWVKGQYVEEK